MLKITCLLILLIWHTLIQLSYFDDLRILNKKKTDDKAPPFLNYLFPFAASNILINRSVWFCVLVRLFSVLVLSAILSHSLRFSDLNILRMKTSFETVTLICWYDIKLAGSFILSFVNNL